MGAPRIHVAVISGAAGKETRRLLVAVQETLPGHLVFHPAITLLAGESLRFEPSLETAIGRTGGLSALGGGLRGSGDGQAESSEE